MLPLIKYAAKKSECWVLTSGFNFTLENAKLLKDAGCKGVVVSIDHYIPELHNMFRGNTGAYEGAINAINAALQVGLVSSLSVCATKQFLDAGHLLPYMDLQKTWGCSLCRCCNPGLWAITKGKMFYWMKNIFCYWKKYLNKSYIPL